MPFRMEFAAVKLDEMTPVVKVRPPLAESRSANSTSEGELTRVGTLGVRTVSESNGKHAIDFDSDIRHVAQGNPRRQQAGEGRARNRGFSWKVKIVRRLDLKLAAAIRPRGRRDQAIRISCTEKETVRFHGR